MSRISYTLAMAGAVRDGAFVRAMGTLLLSALAGCGASTDGASAARPVSDSGASDVSLVTGTDHDDIPTAVDTDASDASVAINDANDAGQSMDVVVPDAGPECTLVPDAIVYGTGYPMPVGGQDLAFDGRGRVAIGMSFNQIMIMSVGESVGPTRPIFTVPGEPVTVRWALTGELLMVLLIPSDASVQIGELAALDPGTGSVRVLVRNVGNPGGLAVDASGQAWFSDGVANTISRIAVGDPAGGAEVVIRDVPRPTGLAFDATGSFLFVANAQPDAAAAIYQVPLNPGDGGMSMTALPSIRYVGGLTYPNDSLTGLAVDQCGNVYAVDQGRSFIWRIGPPPANAVTNLWGGTNYPLGLAFGQGRSFSNRFLYTLDLYGFFDFVDVTAQGVPLPVP